MSISFDMGEDLRDIMDAVHNLASDQIRPHLRDFEEAEGLPDELCAQLHELGLTTLVLPESLGGMDELDTRAAAVVSEELAWGDVGAALAIPGPRSAGFLILELGTDEQQQRLLTPFADEESGAKRRGTLALVDGPFGLDPAAIETTARRDGDHYVVDGLKRYVAFANSADLTIVLARDTGSSAPDPWDQLILLAIEGRDGLNAGEPDRLLGLHTTPYGDLTLAGTRVPASNRLGDGTPGQLRQALVRTVARKHILDAARLVGLARAACEYAFNYATERQTFGVYLYEHQALAFMMAEMAMQTDGMRTLVWEAAAGLDANLPNAPHMVALAHKHAADKAVAIASDAVQVLGGHGYIQDHPVEKWMRDARTLGVVDGLTIETSHFADVA